MPQPLKSESNTACSIEGPSTLSISLQAHVKTGCGFSSRTPDSRRDWARLAIAAALVGLSSQDRLPARL